MISTKSRFLIIVAISTLVVAAIYSSSLPLVFAVEGCDFTSDGKGALCTFNSGTPIEKNYICLKGEDGGWDCEDVGAPGHVSPSLKDALVKAKHIANAGGGNNSSISNGSNETSGNNTVGKIMTLRPPLLKHGLLGNNTQP
jgi:hypothetical protein